MSYESEINKAVQRAIAAAKRQAKVELRETMTNLHQYFADEMQPATARNYKIGGGGKKTKKAITENRRALKNPTTKLYTLYGNLRRALMPKNLGNINKIDTGSGGAVAATIGIDTAVTVPAGTRKTSLIYAAVHEKTRPYFNPALKKYSEEDKETMQNILEAAIVAWNE